MLGLGVYEILFLIPILAGFAIWFAYKSVFKPVYILATIAIASYLGNVFYFMEGAAIPLTLFQVFLFAGIGIIIFDKIRTNDLYLPVTGIDYQLLGFTALVFLSTLYTVNQAEGLQTAVIFFVHVLLIYMYILGTKSVHDVSIIVYALVAISLFLGVYSISDGLLNPEATAINLATGGGRIANRASTTQVDPNVFATQFYLPIAFMSAFILQKKEMFYKVIGTIVLFTLVAGMLSTFSRSGMVAIFFMSLYVMYYYRSVKLLVGGLVVISVLFIAVPAVRDAFMAIALRIVNIFEVTGDDSNFIRLLLIHGGILMFFDSYMLGFGVRSFPIKFIEYYHPDQTVGVTEIHNMFIHILAEFGIIGIILFVWIHFKIFNRAYLNILSVKSINQEILAVSLMGGLIAFNIFYVFYGGMLIDNNYWILIGLVYAQYYHTKSKEESFNEVKIIPSTQ